MTVELQIHADELDGETLQQIYKLRDHPSVDGLIAMMPDTHAGAGVPIGTTLRFGESIVPYFIGVDIGCGMKAVHIGKTEIDFNKLDSEIKRAIPLGMRSREPKAAASVLNRYSEREHCGRSLSSVIDDAIEVQQRLDIGRNPIGNQLGTLGGGNHFVEIGKDSNDDYWLIIHSGSRNFGLQVAEYYQRKAKAITPVGTVPKGSEYLPMDQGGNDYLKDMRVAQRFADANREVMVRMILRALDVNYTDCDVINSIHNYISEIDGICRKGAIMAYKGQEGVIPLNMKDGTLYVSGKGNKDYNFSAPHGAGRVYSRSKMKEMMRNGTYSVADFQKSMDGIFTTTVDASTIDESPLAYKPLSLIQKYLEETVDVIDIIKPVYNLKASGD
jgi:tRNA-splicing ligase RtcB (3'-phosphate/5'-hydroxy nucleic acid ligase)